MRKAASGLLLFFLLWVTAVNASDLERRIVCFYNPAANVESFAALKISFDAYLAQMGPYEWQPFNDYQTLAAFLLKNPSSIVILPSWFYAPLNQRIVLTPFLVGINKKGNSSQQIVLVGKQMVSHPDILRDKLIAVAGSEAFAHQLLAKIFPSQPPDWFAALRILAVPKDIDALMAVGFGMAQFALASEEVLVGLSSINPNLAKALVASKQSHEVLLPIVATAQAASKDNAALVAVIENMGQTPQGQQKLRMMGISGWKRWEPAEAKQLKSGVP